MDTQKEYATLIEAYNAVYDNKESINEDAQKMVGNALDAAAKNPVIKAIGKVIAPVGKGRQTPTKTSGGYRPVKEDVDTFDIVLEYLVSEGFAETNENALAIMANMSEDWRQSIIEGVAERTVKAVDAQRRGSYGDDHDLKTGMDSLGDSMRRLKRSINGRSPKVTPSMPDA